MVISNTRIVNAKDRIASFRYKILSTDQAEQILADAAKNTKTATKPWRCFYGNPKQLWIQILSIVATIAFSAIATLIVISVTKLITNGIRVERDDELEGLDNALHGERAFEIE